MAGRFSVEAVFKARDRLTAPVSRMQNRVAKLTRNMERGFRAVNRTLNNVVSNLRSATTTALKFGAIGVGVVTTAVGLLVREFSKIEDAEAAFTPLLGGAAKAKKLIDDLNETAASTPFQFETLSKSASQLLPVMNGDIQNTIKTIRMLGDTAGGNAQKLDSITRGFTKAMLKGKVDMESLNMIAEAGVPIFTELADSMGVKVNAAFFKMISAGKVTTTQLNKAFEKMTSKGGVFFKGMEISSKTTSGLFSTLKDNIALTAAEIGGVLAPTIKDLIRSATGVAQRVRTWVKENRELINEKFLKFVDLMKVGIDKASTAFAFLSEHGVTILKVIGGIIALSLVLKSFIVVMTAVNLVMMMNPIGLLILAVMALVAAGALIIAKWTPIKAFFVNLWADIVGIFDSAIARVMSKVDKVKNVVSSITGAISNFGSSVGDFLGFGDNEQTDGVTGPQIVTPQERTAKAVDEHRTTSKSEVTIKDETGRAEVTSGELGPGLNLQVSGAF